MDNSEVLSQNAETEGFNVESGQTWIYPTNLPIRDYQYNIVQEALLKNTMVCLPTGLGKTFIAAVVMYNYFRWYPHGKIIFMAPTKPLVKQQVEACYNIMAIPKVATAELTGTTSRLSRDKIWEEKRVFFITPQVLQNDLERITRLAKQIKCLVFDEAHKARGNHAYCEIIKKISPNSKHFRVLALTATPGSTISDVVKVCNDLLISHIEIRSEDSSDVAPFVFKKNIETLVVPLDAKLCQMRDKYIQVLDKYVRVLVQNRVMQGNCSTLTKGRLFYIKKEYEEKNRHTRGPQHNEIMKNLSICLILYHAYEVLIKHGLRGFVNFFKEHEDKPLLRSNNQIKMIVEDISSYLGPIPSVDMLPDGSIPEVPKDTKFGHPKFYKLAEILINYFNKNERNENSRVIVFCEYCDSVMEAYTLLLMYRPLLKPRIFLGQGNITQKQQLNVIQSFRSGECNTLISTSIGEEGLDIGDVNLVVCFDISSKSSIRMIQRIGRTGRKQDGNVIMLVTEGREQQLLQESFAQKDMVNAMKTSVELRKSLYPNSPKMIPDNIKLVCNKIFITVDMPKPKLQSNTLTSMFENMNQNSLYEDIEIVNFEDRISCYECHFNKTKSEVLDETMITCQFDIEKNRIFQSTYGRITSSSDSEILVSLLEYANSKRFNITLSQSNIVNKQSSNTDNFKQSDIRAMFQKQQIFSKNVCEDHKDEVDEKLDSNNLKELQSELEDYLYQITLTNLACKMCDTVFPCISYKQEMQLLDHWLPPDKSVMDSLTQEGLKNFKGHPKMESAIEFDEIDDDILAEFDENDLKLKDINQVEFDKNDFKSTTANGVEFDEFDLDAELGDSNMQNLETTPPKIYVNFDLPKTAKKLLLEYNSNRSLKNDNELSGREQSTTELGSIQKILKNTPDSNDISCKNLNPDGKLQKSDSTKNPICANSTKDISPKNYNFDEYPQSPVYNKCDTTESINESTPIKNKHLQSPDIFDIESDDDTMELQKSSKTESEANRRSCKKSLRLDDICDSSILNLLKASQEETMNKIVDKTNKSQLTNKIVIDSCNKKEMIEIKLNNANQTMIPNNTDKKRINKIKQTNISSDSICDSSFMDLFFPSKQRDAINKSKKPHDGQDKTKLDVDKETITCNESENLKRKLFVNEEIVHCENSDKTQMTLTNSTQFKNDSINEIKEQKLASKNSKPFSKIDSPKINTPKMFNEDDIFDSSILCDSRTKSNPNKLNVELTRQNFNKKNINSSEAWSPKIKMGSPNIHFDDIFSDDFLPDVVKSQQSSQGNTAYTPSHSNIIKRSNKNKKLQLNKKTKDCEEVKESVHHKKKGTSLKKNISLVSSQENVLKLLTKSVKLDGEKEKEVNISQGSDDTLIISPETLSIPPEMHSPATGVTIDDDFESPEYSYNYKKKKTQSPASRTKLEFSEPFRSLLDPNNLFDFECEGTPEKLTEIGEVNVSLESNKKKEKCDDLFDIFENPINIFPNKMKSFNRKTKNNVSKLCTKKRVLSQRDIFDNSILNIFSDTHRDNNTNISFNEKTCENKNTKISNKNLISNSEKDFNNEQQKNIAKNLNLKHNKYSDTLKWCQKNQSQHLNDSSKKSQTGDKDMTFNNSIIDTIMEKYLSPKSNQSKSWGELQTSPLSRENKESCNSPILNRKRRLIESPSSPVLSGNKKMKTPIDLDDDFEQSVVVLNKSSGRKQLSSDDTINNLSDEDFVKPQSRSRVKKKKKLLNSFFETEAALSSDASVSSDERSGSSQDRMEESFVNDETMDLGNTTVMHAHYLKTTRSPNVKAGFKIPKLRTKAVQDIFSQTVQNVDNTYLEDSFCVRSDKNESSQEELSELEIAERILKEKRNMKKKPAISLASRKRRRILRLSSDSD